MATEYVANTLRSAYDLHVEPRRVKKSNYSINVTINRSNKCYSIVLLLIKTWHCLINNVSERERLKGSTIGIKRERER